MPENEGKRCFMRSLSYWSNKTLESNMSQVLYVKQSFTAQIPNAPALLSFCAKNPSKFAYHAGTPGLTVHGRMEEREYRDLLSLYPGQSEVHAELRQLRGESQLYLLVD